MIACPQREGERDGQVGLGRWVVEKDFNLESWNKVMLMLYLVLG
jgi:hypothetical protein